VEYYKNDQWQDPEGQATPDIESGKKYSNFISMWNE
jgi:hypothetical protein